MPANIRQHDEIKGGIYAPGDFARYGSLTFYGGSAASRF